MAGEAAPAGRFFRLFYNWSQQVVSRGSRRAQARNLHASTPSCTSFTKPHSQLHKHANEHALTPPRSSIRDARESVRGDAKIRAPQRRAYHRSACLRQQKDADAQARTLPDQMRTMMRRIPHSVVIVAPVSSITNRPSNHPEDAPPPLAMTVSSFNTVCLQPTPVISFNTKLPSSTLRKIEEEDGMFDVFLLLSQGSAATIAHEFAGGYGEQPMRYSLRDHREDDPEASSTQIKRCLTAEFDGLVGILRCKQRLEQSMLVEDHRIVVADVLEMNESEAASEAQPPKPDPPNFGLVYAGGKYWRVDRQKKDPLMLEWPSNAPKPQPVVEETTSSRSFQES